MKKKTLMSLTAAAVLAVNAASLTAHGEAGLFMIGDVNGDGTVDSMDASSVLDAYASVSSGHESPLYSYEESAGDVNGDGRLDATDASMILSYYAWASVGDEGAIFSDFLEQNGFEQRITEEKPAAEAPQSQPTEVQQAVEATDYEYTLPRIDSEFEEWFWVGDSRTVGLSYSVAIDNIAKVGAGIGLFRNNYDQICQIRNKTVIINLGVNDLDSGAYLRLYNSLPDEFLDNNKVIVMSVNPCSGGYVYLNSRIEAFNNALRDGLDSRITFLDSYTYLVWNGYGTTDGLHYTANTYIDIYNFVYDSIFLPEE
ncbi:MAG: hypothetical protein J6X85_08030 [Ruminococcus sp.]|nr:hypothetical protein [Ruminococcus sp.]